MAFFYLGRGHFSQSSDIEATPLFNPLRHMRGIELKPTISTEIFDQQKILISLISITKKSTEARYQLQIAITI